MKIRRFKQWWQVYSAEAGGGTIAQFLSRTQALDFIAINDHPFPTIGNVAYQMVSRTRGYTMRRISVYP